MDLTDIGTFMKDMHLISYVKTCGLSFSEIVQAVQEYKSANARITHRAEVVEIEDQAQLVLGLE